MIIGNRETFIGIKITSIIGKGSFYHFAPQENYTQKHQKDFSFQFIQTGQDP